MFASLHPVYLSLIFLLSHMRVKCRKCNRAATEEKKTVAKDSRSLTASDFLILQILQIL